MHCPEVGTVARCSGLLVGAECVEGHWFAITGGLCWSFNLNSGPSSTPNLWSQVFVKYCTVIALVLEKNFGHAMPVATLNYRRPER